MTWRLLAGLSSAHRFQLARRGSTWSDAAALWRTVAEAPLSIAKDLGSAGHDDLQGAQPRHPLCPPAIQSAADPPPLPVNYKSKCEAGRGPGGSLSVFLGGVWPLSVSNATSTASNCVPTQVGIGIIFGFSCHMPNGDYLYVRRCATHTLSVSRHSSIT